MITDTAPDTAPLRGTTSSKRLLEPIERVSEILFGLIMVLSFTGALSVAEAGRADVREMLIGALGCNLAWGIIDAVFYLMACLAEKGRNLQTLKAVRATGDPGEAQRLLAGALPPTIAAVLDSSEFGSLHRRLQALPEPPKGPRLSLGDWVGAFGVCLLVFLSTLPVVLPFIFMHEIAPAMRVSNGIAIVLLALAGVGFSRMTGRNRWVDGIAAVLLGTLLVALTIALGG
jgi:hypothetical protein